MVLFKCHDSRSISMLDINLYYISIWSSLVISASITFFSIILVRILYYCNSLSILKVIMNLFKAQGT